MIANEALVGGFAEPVFEAQAIFRALMDGYARPGTIGASMTEVKPPEQFGKASASILLALCDFETKVWLSNALSAPKTRGWIDFHSGAPLADNESAAAFAFAVSAAELPKISHFAQGTDEYPDTSTTIILEVASLEDGTTLILEGPGIKDRVSISPNGLPANFLAEWERNGALFPCGVDLVLTTGDRFMCLPRTTRIRGA